MINAENAEFQIVQALRLSRTKRAALGEVFIEGTESVKMAVRAGLEITRIIIPASRARATACGSGSRAGLSQWACDLIRAGARVLEMADGLYAKLCERRDLPEILVTAKRTTLTLADLNLGAKPFVLLFDRPSDMGNLGSVIRSFNSFGGDALLILGHGVDPWDPKVIRASLGSVFFTPVVPLRSNGELGGFIAEQKKLNAMRVWGTDSGGAIPLSQAPLERPLLLAIGNEAKGISAALKQICDGIVSIPLAGDVNSLNAACAASVCMWELCRRSGAPPAAPCGAAPCDAAPRSATFHSKN
ncbi:MAG: RNA methyltransferase [Treponema sp.]|jgi:TrmH family RNA methyltransferase|nr:RNA methyltransferase [Treponema sp.]